MAQTTRGNKLRVSAQRQCMPCLASTLLGLGKYITNTLILRRGNIESACLRLGRSNVQPRSFDMLAFATLDIYGISRLPIVASPWVKGPCRPTATRPCSTTLAYDLPDWSITNHTLVPRRLFTYISGTCHSCLPVPPLTYLVQGSTSFDRVASLYFRRAALNWSP